MKVSINIDKVGGGLDKLIMDKLSEKELPSCLGNMTPPLLSRIINVDDSIVFKPKSSVAKEQVIENAAAIVVTRIDDLDDDLKGTDLVLTKEGLDYIEDYKERRAQEYVDHVSNCVACDLIDICYKLTKNFLTLVRLEGIFKG